MSKNEKTIKCIDCPYYWDEDGVLCCHYFHEDGYAPCEVDEKEGRVETSYNWEKAYEQLTREVYAREDYLLDEFVKRLIERLPMISPAVFINLAKYTKEELRKAEEVSDDGRTDN